MKNNVTRKESTEQIQGFPKAEHGCQDPLGLSSRERGRYDLQTIIFGEMKNKGNIAELGPPEETGSGFAFCDFTTNLEQ